MPKSKYFLLKELVPKAIYLSHGMNGWNLLDQKALEVLDWIREGVDLPIIVNDWSFGGLNNYRGYRPMDCNIGAKYSAHKQGKAFDISVKGWTDEQLKEWIETNKQGLPHNIRIEIENTNSKVHFDTNAFGDEKIEYFKP